MKNYSKCFYQCLQYASFDETGSRGVFIRLRQDATARQVENAILCSTGHANAIGTHFSSREKFRFSLISSPIIPLARHSILATVGHPIIHSSVIPEG